MRTRRLALVAIVGSLLGLKPFPSPDSSGFLSHRLVARLDAQAGPQIARGPYLQLGTPTSLVVRWRTTAATDSVVDYGPDPANLIFSARASTLTTDHEVELALLQPATKYYYSVGLTTQRLAGGDSTHFFVTAPPIGSASPTRIWVLGDSGTADLKAETVRDAYYAFSGSTFTNLWLMLGDNAYNDGLDTEYQRAVFEMYPTTLRQSVLWPTKGNHDTSTAPGVAPYYDIFTLPSGGQAGGLASGTEAYYSFDYGNIHFICLNSFDVDLSAGSPMLTWLQNDLASTTARWIIAYWHHPPYSKGSHDSDIDFELTEMRQNAVPILEAGGVDLVLTGHSHSYERSFLIDGHYGRSNTFANSMKVDAGSGRESGTGAYRKFSASPAPHAGTVYAVAGSSGNIGGGTLDHPAMFVSLNVMGSLVLDVNDGRLDVQFVDDHSAVRDSFTILKDPVAPLVVATTSLPNGGTRTPYLQTLAATGGRQPYAWSLLAGSLPAGLALNAATGVISGTPTAPLTSLFTVRVTDSAVPAVTADRELSIAIAAEATVPNVITLTEAAAVAAITNAALTRGTVSSGAHPSVPIGSVISQDPAGGSQAPIGTAVNLVVSTGVTVPQTVGLSQSAATALISSVAGLSVGAITTVSSTTIAAGLVISQNPAANTSVSGGTNVALVISSGNPRPVVIGSQIAGTFADASGHSGQSHLFYAANAGVWWLLTLSSSADSQGGTNHLIKAYRSSGPDLASATWTAAASSPGAAVAGSVNCGNCSMGGGRSLGVAYINNAPTDAVHAEVAMAFNGQNGLTAHIRATVTATTISWAAWSYFDAPAATWTMPRGNALGVSTGKKIHSGGPILQQEVDANVRVSTNADTGAAWTSGFSGVSLIDNSMFHQSNSMTFAALASNRMLSVYDNGGGQAPCYGCTGGVPEPTLSNLGYRRSNADGSWPTLVPGGQATGDGKVFPADATIDQNDWTLVSRDTASIYAFRRNAAGTGVDGATYNLAANTWGAFASPPLFGPGQSHKPGSGVFGAATGSGISLFVISNDSSNSILYTKYEAAAWSAWATVPGTDAGPHVRKFISGYPIAAAGQIGVVWTEGTTQFDVVATSISLASTVPDVLGLAQAVAGTRITGAQLAVGVIAHEASATVAAGLVISQSPVAGSPVASGSAVSLVISLGVAPVPAPDVVNATQASATALISGAGLAVGVITQASSATVPAGSVISQDPPGGTLVPANGAINLLVSTGPPVFVVPNVVALTQSAASSAITGAGLAVGTISSSSSATVPSGSVISQNPASGTQVAFGSAVSLVVSSGPAAPSPIVDQVVFSDGNSTRTTPSFSTSAANELLLAFVGSDGPAGGGSQTVTVTGAGLTWTLVRRANVQAGTSEVWQAKAAARLTNVTVKSTQSMTGYRQSLTVVTFRGASGVGASAAANAATGAPSVTLVTTKSNALVYGVGTDWDRAVARTLGSSQAMVHQSVVTAVGDTFWVQSRNAAVTSAGTSVQVNCTAPTNDRWNLVGVEVVP